MTLMNGRWGVRRLDMQVRAVSWSRVLNLAAVGVLSILATPVMAQDAAQLQKRVQQLEQQLVDMQVVMGTLETLAGSNGGARSAPPAGGGFSGSYGGGGADSGRLDVMETQIRALTAQMEQLSRDVRAMSGGRRGSVSPSNGFGGGSEQRFGAAATRPPPATTGGFGSTTVTPGAGGYTAPQNDPIGGYLSSDPSSAGGTGWGSAGQQVARAPLGNGDPKQVYETAYGYLLQQDYVSAESAFGDFLSKFPQDGLASNAQYWLGETYFVRGQYKSAANAFLKGYETYRTGSKAPDSLLKLAMSLDRLGQRDAACSSLSELTARFPQAPPHVKRTARSEQSRAGC